MAETTRLKDIYTCLKSAGIDVYFPGQHKGECSQSYVVIKPGGASVYMGLSTTVDYYELLCYTPEKYPSLMVEFKEQVRQAMLSIHPMIRDAHTETTPYFDEAVKAWMVDMTYINYRKYNSPSYQENNN